MRRGLSRALWVITFLAVMAAAAGFCWLAFGVAENKDGGWLAVVGVLVVGIGSAVSHYALAPKSGASPRRPFWTTWKGLAAIFTACVTGAGAMSLLLPVIDPPAATEATVTDDGDKTRAELERRLPLESERPIVAALPGLWGEAGCAVVYRFQVTEGGLEIELVRKAPGMADYTMTAALTPGGDGDAANATIVRSSDVGEVEGQALLFTYERAGTEERLNWRNLTHAGYGGTKLERCR